MEICPVCNGLKESTVLCDKCGIVMTQMGRMEDYKGPYSPYMDQESFLYNNVGLTGDNCCIHLYECPSCGQWQHNEAAFEAY